MDINSRNLPGLLICSILLLTGGCSTGVKLQIESDVPMPLVTQIPLTAGVYYDEQFRNYIFTEDSEDRKGWEIDNREARLSLFNQILSSLFEQVTQIEDPAATDTLANVSALLRPEVIDTQFALPEETHSDLYEAWIKYKLGFFQPDGTPITEWEVTGYGKASSEFMSGKNKGLNSAMNVALRDVGAKIILQFSRTPEVREWLADRIDCEMYSDLC